MDVSKNVYDGERQFCFQMIEGYKVSCVKILMFWYITKTLNLLEILHTSAKIKNCKNVLKSGCFLKDSAIESANFLMG